METMHEIENRFSTIFKENSWQGKESVSGPGSSVAATAELTPQLIGLIAKLGVRNFCDAPCGDFNWIGPVARHVDHYLGLDIVPELIELAASRAEGIGTCSFLHFNIVEETAPRSDIIFCRDCLVHLTFAQTLSAISNFKASGSTWLLTTTFPEVKDNRDVATGAWRPINLSRAPYMLPAPTEFIVERPLLAPHPQWGRKCLGLWRLDEIEAQ